MTKRVAKPPESPAFLCVSRSVDQVGTLKCSCSNAPPVYRCDNPAILSGFATPDLPSRTGDGPILFKAGTTTEEKFVPYPLRDGETPRKNEVICCSSCPYRQEPAPEVVAVRELGVGGGRPDGTCDILHVIEPRWDYKGRMWAASTPEPIVGAYMTYLDTDAIRKAIVLTKARVVVVHALVLSASTVDAIAQDSPSVTFVGLFHGSQNNLMYRPSWAHDQLSFLKLAQERENCFYATPDRRMSLDTLGWPRCVWWPNLALYSPHEFLPPTIEPAQLLICGRFDIVKGLPAAFLAAGLVHQRTPIEVLSIVDDRSKVITSLAETAKVPMKTVKFMDWPVFQQFLRSSVSLTIHPSLTDAHPHVPADSLSQGRPCVGSPAIDYLPEAWQVDPNDPAQIAHTVLAILDNYAEACELAQATANQWAGENAAAFLQLYERLTSR